ncbi:MAG: hypothetical protein IJM79_00710 [Erysipelotrichaceae bacterium]|nr:hypothetical protein [Erysipelotrichaceae bacterium]
MYQVNKDTLIQLEDVTERINKLSALLERLRRQEGTRGIDYQNRSVSRPGGEGPQVQHFNQLWSLENRLETLKRNRQEISMALLDYLLALPGQSRRDFAIEYYLHGRRNFKDIADRIGLSVERTYHLRREVRESFAALMQNFSVLQLNDSAAAQDGSYQQCSDGNNVVG